MDEIIWIKIACYNLVNMKEQELFQYRPVVKEVDFAFMRSKESNKAAELMKKIDALRLEDEEQSPIVGGIQVTRKGYDPENGMGNHKSYILSSTEKGNNKNLVTIGEGNGTNYINFEFGMNENLDKLTKVVDCLVEEMSNSRMAV